MKKQGSIFLKVVFGVLGVSICMLLVLRAIQPESRQLQLETAVAYEVGDGVSTSGFVVRSETVISQANSLLVLTRKEGEWVGKGQSVATAYRTEEARSRQLELEQMEEEVEQLEYAYTYAAANTDMATLDTNIEQQLVRTAVGVAQRDLTAAEDGAAMLKTYILRRYTGSDDTQALLSRITELRSQIDAIGTTSSAVASEIAAPEAGYFSSSVDGLEAVLTPDSLQTMTVADFRALSAAAPGAGSCKVITSNHWYYVTEVPTDQLGSCEAGDYVSVRFAYHLTQDLSMRVFRVGEDEDGRCLLVLTSDANVADTAGVRQESADVVFRTQSGLRVPKEGLYINEDGEPGVYILEGACADWKQVEIIRDNGDSYLVVQDTSSIHNLWPGDEIILTDEEIYDGKVVSP